MGLESGLLDRSPMDRHLRCTQLIQRNTGLHDDALFVPVNSLHTGGRDQAPLALSQDPGEVSSHEEV